MDEVENKFYNFLEHILENFDDEDYLDCSLDDKLGDYRNRPLPEREILKAIFFSSMEKLNKFITQENKIKYYGQLSDLWRTSNDYEYDFIFFSIMNLISSSFFLIFNIKNYDLPSTHIQDFHLLNIFGENTYKFINGWKTNVDFIKYLRYIDYFCLICK